MKLATFMTTVLFAMNLQAALPIEFGSVIRWESPIGFEDRSDIKKGFKLYWTDYDDLTSINDPIDLGEPLSNGEVSIYDWDLIVGSEGLITVPNEYCFRLTTYITETASNGVSQILESEMSEQICGKIVKKPGAPVIIKIY